MATFSSTTALLLLPQPQRPTVPGVLLPSSRDNLFERLIRDPTAPHRPARERLCTEMLCGVLINAPRTRQIVLKWLAKLSGIDSLQFDSLDWKFTTEGAMGSKRDDLRIEGFEVDESGDRRVILWTVEVKVAAEIHQSSEQFFNDDENEECLHIVEEKDSKMVSQLKNYDHWLSQQAADHRAGFVLAITDQSGNLPESLQLPWHCTTWTDLARDHELALAEDSIPPTERLLTSHMCGFIRDHLWNEEDMSSSRFDFDDLALIRAFALIGTDCFNKVHALVAGLEEELADLLQGAYESCRQQKSLRSSFNRSVIYVKFLPEAKGLPASPGIYAGIVGGDACVCLESSPPSPAKAKLSKLALKFGPLLRERNANWEVIDDESSWSDLLLCKPLAWILAAEDQQAALREFIVGAIADLKEVGLIETLKEELQIGGSSA